MDNARLRQAKISNSSKRGLLASVLYSSLFTTLFSLSFILVLSLVAYKSPDPTKFVIPFSYVCLVICSFISGYSGAKFRGSQGFISGILSGCAFGFLIFILSQFFEKEKSLPFAFVIFTFFCIILISSLGGIFASRSKKQKRKSRR